MKSIAKLLNQCFKLGINSITIPYNKSMLEIAEIYDLPVQDVDYITFYQDISTVEICDKLVVNSIIKTDKPVYKNWFMSFNVHA